MEKIFYLDVETTGLRPREHDVVKIAYIIEIDGQVQDKGLLTVQPFNYAAIDPMALEINGITVAEMRTFPQPQEIHRTVMDILDRHTDKYKRSDRFSLAGHNVRFDLAFMDSFCLKCGNRYFRSWFNRQTIDTLPMLRNLRNRGLVSLERCTLGHACRYFGIGLTPHDPVSDIEATREVLRRCRALDNTNSPSNR